MNRTDRAQEMLAHVAAWQQSGKSRKSYCQEHGLTVNVLSYWCARAKTKESRHGFAAVEVTMGNSLELHYPNGVRLLLPWSTALDHLAAFIRLY